MITVLPYEQWLEAKREAYIAEHGDDEGVQTVWCPKCDGDGEVVCDMGHEHDCDRCGGWGIIDANNLNSWEADPRGFDKESYFTDVVMTIRRYCAFSNRDYLAEVGPFVREWRVPVWSRSKQEQAA